MYLLAFLRGPFWVHCYFLPNNLVSSTKLFADDTSLFSIVTSIEKSCNDLNGDLDAIKMWAHQWKMSFNPDLNKQASEVVFSKKRTPKTQPPLLFNNAPVLVVPYQKHLGLTLDRKLAFDHHLNEKIAKANRGIGLIKQLSGSLPRSALVTMYRSFVRPHLDYADVIYDQPHNDTFCSRIESVQYNAALAITGAIRGTSREKIYQELGLESLRDRRWYRRLCLFYKIASEDAPQYLIDILPGYVCSSSVFRRNLFIRIPSRSNYFANSFFQYSINEWNKLDVAIRELDSLPLFKKSILKFIRPKPSPIYNIMDSLGLKLLTRLRVSMSHLKDHKHRHNFTDTLVPLCNCGLLESETTSLFLLRCSFYGNQRKLLLDNIIEIIGDIFVSF